MDILSVNEVIRDNLNDKEYRILWIDEGYVIAYFIDLYAKSPSPFAMSLKEVTELIKEEQLIKVKEDVFELNKLKNSINSRHIEMRNVAWESIQDIVSLQPEIYEKNKRGKLIHEAAEKSGETYNTILKRLRKYWTKGMTKNSLLPDYDNCGVFMQENM